MRHALAYLALAAVFIAGCSAVAPSPDGLDGATTTISIGAGAGDPNALGVPFVDGLPVVETVGVKIFASDDPQNPVDLHFTLADGLYSYDPDGLVTTIGFAFQGTVDVALPAGHDYSFEATGSDGSATWLAYGVTSAHVAVTTTGVKLALQTMIDSATLDTVIATTAVEPGAAIDLFLTVSSPGGYAVPVADYAVSYAILPEDGTLAASSKVGTRAVATASPVTDTFTLTATITGWSDVAGVATMSDVTTTFTAPYAVTSGMEFDTTAPVVTFDATTEPAYAGTVYALSGTASDDTGVDRVQLYEGPVLIGSTEPVEYDADGVAAISLVGNAWTMDWIPTEARTHTLTAIAIDAAGNDDRATTSIDVAELTTLTFVNGEFEVPATLTAGESVVLRGTATASFDARDMFIELYSFADDTFSHVSTVGVVVADGMWTLDWTAPLVGSYRLEYAYFGVDSFEHGSFNLTVE